MFYITIDCEQLPLLNTTGVPVNINGVERVLTRKNDCLIWTDEEGQQIRPIAFENPSLAPVAGKAGVHKCILFTCCNKGDEGMIATLQAADGMLQQAVVAMLSANDDFDDGVTL